MCVGGGGVGGEGEGRDENIRNTAQMKEQGRNLQEQINKEEIANTTWKRIQNSDSKGVPKPGK